MPLSSSSSPSRLAVGLASAAVLAALGAAAVSLWRLDAPGVAPSAPLQPSAAMGAQADRAATTGDDPRANRSEDRSLHPVFASGAEGWHDSPAADQASAAARNASSAARTDDAGTPPPVAAPQRRGPEDGTSLMTVLPPSLIEVARKTTWNQQATESLDRLLLIAFDANGDLVLDDLERIAAVQAMRDVMWPTAADDAQALVRDVMDGRRSDVSSDATLQPEDLRLHHDVDESRRLDHAANQDAGEAMAVPGDRATLHAEVVEAFQLDDDGRLAAAEFARFLRHYRSGGPQADLNRDGRADEADLRLFLDVARPIPTGAPPPASTPPRN